MSSEPVACPVDPAVAEELPGLRLWALDIIGGDAPTPDTLKARLRAMSSRFRGQDAIALRSKPIPHAYRVFFRHIGLDPDATRTPVEEAALQRLIRGAFEATNLLDDALLIALVETGVPLWALDADRVAEPLGITLEAGRLVVVDDAGLVAPLFGELEPRVRVTRETARMLLFAVQAPGVPEIFVEEAMWSCLGVLQPEG
jgi:DNA/RNA-binding domain of Phe-tRNA-synthetase-like protein